MSKDDVLRIDPVADAFLGVTVPPETTEVEIMYVPRRYMALTWVSNLALLTFGIIFCVASVRRVRRV